MANGERLFEGHHAQSRRPIETTHRDTEIRVSFQHRFQEVLSELEDLEQGDVSFVELSRLVGSIPHGKAAVQLLGPSDRPAFNRDRQFGVSTNRAKFVYIADPYVCYVLRPPVVSLRTDAIPCDRPTLALSDTIDRTQMHLALEHVRAEFENVVQLHVGDAGGVYFGMPFQPQCFKHLRNFLVGVKYILGDWNLSCGLFLDVGSNALEWGTANAEDEGKLEMLLFNFFSYRLQRATKTNTAVAPNNDTGRLGNCIAQSGSI